MALHIRKLKADVAANATMEQEQKIMNFRPHAAHESSLVMCVNGRLLFKGVCFRSDLCRYLLLSSTVEQTDILNIIRLCVRWFVLQNN